MMVKIEDKTCKINGCTNLVRAKDLCTKHYSKERYKESYLRNKINILKRNKKHYIQNRDKLLEQDKGRRIKNKDKIREYKRQFYLENRDKFVEYQIKNKQEISRRKKEYQKRRRHTDPLFKLREAVSKAIRYGLRLNHSSKDNSVIDYLSYTTDQLKQYLESQFEPWMTWDNWGKYDSKLWDDNDPATWTWQIDHIIPHSTFRYISMEDEEFKRCWALENLRPYSAKQNVLDGKRNRGR